MSESPASLVHPPWGKVAVGWGKVVLSPPTQVPERPKQLCGSKGWLSDVLRCPPLFPPDQEPPRAGPGFSPLLSLRLEPPGAKSESPLLALQTMIPQGWARIPSPAEWAPPLTGPESSPLLLCPQISCGPGYYSLPFLLCPKPRTVHGPGILRN